MKGLDAHFETLLIQHQRKIDAMKTYKVTASYITYCTAEIEAESLEQAIELARDLDGGCFESEVDGDDWNIEDVEEIEA